MRKYVLILVLMEYFYNTINKIICIPKYQIVYPQWVPYMENVVSFNDSSWHCDDEKVECN